MIGSIPDWELNYGQAAKTDPMKSLGDTWEGVGAKPYSPERQQSIRTLEMIFKAEANI